MRGTAVGLRHGWNRLRVIHAQEGNDLDDDESRWLRYPPLAPAGISRRSEIAAMRSSRVSIWATMLRIASAHNSSLSRHTAPAARDDHSGAMPRLRVAVSALTEFRLLV